MVILETENVVKTFGELRAVDDFSLELEEGSIVGLIGPNGAGKTTFFNTVTGIYRPDNGRVRLKGENIEGLRPWQISRKGLVKTFQIPRALENLTVLENMMIPPRDQTGENFIRSVLRDGKVLREERDNLDRALELLKEGGLYERRNDDASELSVGQSKLLEVTRTLMTDPDILLLDEPTAGTTTAETKAIMDYIKRLNEEKNITFLVVEHKMGVIMNLCEERIIVLVNGAHFAEGTARDIQTNEDVKEVYLGKGT